ncbi:hypothetical protein COS31_03250 [Candidatus Roizmanbacteria bacterium CG02_land_8_20_14_3_00_36_15]|uniref:Uncharacterized protein n=2 Tax=Candidatus Roizmaniibacteriota TaxID=1752723 RepID=A0A2M8KLH8_9BACT|nr:MAG: hypothetical protein COS51_03540 [Candidatus Roizmanbacteria bacterium CG03_land_8_20_14_0_80_36_21]PIV37693.1 MAG: hypothetical protein COS31_03250 [Candidatus Roizmanbacteria bacterium CG02_land_8_20_14_3_00_36_15]PIY69650.1 MAG: hypothetical protein COY89_05255 [Candidatus Roizmanbacteria bacterium CG_4_10_14_0_8_um_filter_36_36]PJA53522.1 MAG: hypothetical protein CO166_01460 [Candidatus Roizmanbacteria bacterium CG_4_9_14_3_um_filter_36_11]PJC82160.1 MAG: hypothetical protein CO007
MKIINLRLRKKLNEVYVIGPNDLGSAVLNNLFKKTTGYFKTAPFIIVIPLSLLITILIYLFFGFLLVRLVSLLQYGF